MFDNHPDVLQALNARNKTLAKFWFSEPNARHCPRQELIGRSVLVIDVEDAFTGMLAQQLSAIGLNVTIVNFDKFHFFEGGWDLIVMGPGPGDPRNMNDSRIASVHSMVSGLLIKRQPMLAICLSHQILCMKFGFKLIRRNRPNQGAQRGIDFFGAYNRVGFYNTYVAKCNQEWASQTYDLPVKISKDDESNEIHALRGSHFVSMQFHPESILTQHGIDILADSAKKVMNI